MTETRDPVNLYLAFQFHTDSACKAWGLLMYVNTSVYYFIMYFDTVTAQQYDKLEWCEIVMVVSQKTYVFRDVVLCWWESTAWHFRVLWCLHLQDQAFHDGRIACPWRWWQLSPSRIMPLKIWTVVTQLAVHNCYI